MPLTTRAVSPTDLSLHRLSASVRRDELQCVANGTLANLIRQLSSLSRNAEQLFGEIHRETLKIEHKTNTLFLRVEKLAQKVNLAELKPETGSLEENHMRKAFKSLTIIDQQSLHAQTLPNSLLEVYQKCDPPPQLDLLNPYRDDPKPALRHYTDPTYFFDLWKQEMLKECRANRTTRSPVGASNKSPNRRRRQREVQNGQNEPQGQMRQQQVHNLGSQAQQAANVLLSHYGTTGTHMSRAANQNYAQRVQADAFLHFPAEYQAPQHAMMASNRMQVPPPGMSLHPSSSTAGMTIADSSSSGYSSSGQRIHYQSQTVYNQQDSQQRAYSMAAPPQYSGGLQQNPISMSQMQADLGGPASGLPSQTDSVMCLDRKIADMNLDKKAPQQPYLPGFLEDDDDELPPPPPPVLSGQTMGLISHAGNSTSSMPNETQNVGNTPTEMPPHTQSMQFVPSGTSSGVTKSNVPPPPPPPPPQALASGSFASAISNQAPKVGIQPSNGDVQEKPGQSPIPAIDADAEEDPKTPANGTNNTVSNEGGQMSSLLMEIQSGIKLKKVQRQAELAEARAASESNDVAAILRRRMEHVLGNDDDSSGSNDNGDDGEWDD